MDSETFDKVLSDQSFKFIEMINHRFGGTCVVREFVLSEANKLDENRTLRVLDIGSGSCDIAIAVCKSAEKIGIPIEFTCVELSSYAVNRAHEHLQKFPNLPIKIVCEDIFTHSVDEQYDIAIGSMFFHHLRDSEIIDLLEYLRKIVSGTVLINDVERCWINYIGAELLAIPESSGVRHDATLSVKRGFRLDELRTLLKTMSKTIIEVKRRFPFRVTAFIKYDILMKDRP